MNADPNEQLMRIPVVKILSFSLRNGHGVVVGLVRLLVVISIISGYIILPVIQYVVFKINLLYISYYK